jgi:hypothetical protein
MQGFLDLFISINCSTCFRQFSAHHGEQKTVHTASGIVKPILLPAAIVAEMELMSSISSTIAACSNIGLTIPDAVCTVLCFWWWAEEPPETCRAIYRNTTKEIEKKLHLVGCTLEMYLRCADIWTSNFSLLLLQNEMLSSTYLLETTTKYYVYHPCKTGWRRPVL